VSTIEFKEVRKTFTERKHRTRWTLGPISFRIADGERFGILGPVGSGKTTLVRLIAGLEQPEEGSIWFNGTDVTQVPAHQRRFGIVFQHEALFPHLTVRENLLLPLKLKNAASDSLSLRWEEVIQLLGLESLLDRRPNQLSGGQRRKVAFGRALLAGGDLLLLDEPFTHLDPPTRRQLLLQLLDLQRRFRFTLVYVSHIPQEIRMLCERAMILFEGQMIQLSSPVELWTQPKELRVLQFVTAGEINLFRGQIQKEGSRLWFVFPPSKPTASLFRLPLPISSADLPAGQEILLAVLPDQIELSFSPEHSPSQALPGRVVLISEETGLLTLTIQSSGLPPVLARVPVRLCPQPPTLGMTIHWSCAPSALLFFDPTTGRRINLSLSQTR